MTDSQHVQDAFDRAYAGGPERHRSKAAEQGKLPVRERVARLLDDDSLAEDALLANWEADGLGADGVVTGMRTIGWRTVALMSNDPTLKAGSWATRTAANDRGTQASRAAATSSSSPTTRGSTSRVAISPTSRATPTRSRRSRRPRSRRRNCRRSRPTRTSRGTCTS